MAMTETCFTRATRGPVTGKRPSFRQRLALLFDTPFERRYRARRESIAALQAMSDAELAAIGLERGQIVAHVFRGGVAVS
jgi:uncharacterized protein YjiS (DUF1127 family)